MQIILRHGSEAKPRKMLQLTTYFGFIETLWWLEFQLIVGFCAESFEIGKVGRLCLECWLGVYILAICWLLET